MTIRLDNLSIGYKTKGNHTVVAGGITAEVRSSELTCLLGTNGVGKSTLLRTLSAFQPKLGGNIYIDGRDLDTFAPKELARTVGVVLTDKPEVPHTTVRELVAAGRQPYTGFWGRCSADDMGIVDRAIAMTGITHLAGRMVSTLSDGERQKAMIAKALAQQTPIIMLDEPTAFLDYPSKVETMQLLHRVSREAHKTVFLSTHDVELALQIADTVWLMSRGEGIVSGTPEDLALDGTLPAFFRCPGIAFDADKGLFALTSTATRSVRLTGLPGQRMAMAAKALLRNGIATGPSPSSESLSSPDAISIEVTPDAFIVRHRGTEKQCHTIADMLAEV